MQFKSVTSAPGEGLDAVIVPVFRDSDGDEPRAAAGASAELRRQAEWLARETGGGKLFSTATHLESGAGGGHAWRLVVVEAGKSADFDHERAWQAVSAGARSLWGSKAGHLGVCLETANIGLASALEAGVEGVLFAMWDPRTYRTGEGNHQLPPLDEVLLIAGDAGQSAESAQAAIARGDAVGEAVNWARARSNEPANRMTPSDLAAAARDLAAAHSLDFAVIEEDEAARMGMGSYLSVARGSDEPAKFIVMRYRGRDTNGYDLALVGKGITFDSGGISLKDPQDMHLMKHDMAGAAAVLGSMGAIARLGLPLNVICVAPATENLPGGHATKPGDVFTSLSGKTVEVINTDAEGRLVLLDGVAYAQREGASRVVDVATLTGAVRVALGRHYTGVFGRPEGFVDQVRRAGARAGERMWPLPLSDEFRDDMKSDIADLRNSGGRLGGASLGAAFIDAAIRPETEWVHLDIASTAWYEEERSFSPKGPQGTPVRTLVELASSIAGRDH
jgi:leucyl aminopeptidase